MRCENKQCQLPYRYNQGKRFEFSVRPWTWGFSYIPGQKLPEFRWLCERCAEVFDVQQEENWIGLVSRSEPASQALRSPSSANVQPHLPSLAHAPAES